MSTDPKSNSLCQVEDHMKRIAIALTLLLLTFLFVPDVGIADRRDRGFAKPDSFQVRAETHLKCRASQPSYSSGDLTSCFNEGMDPEFKFDLSYQSIKLESGSKGFVDIPRMASRFVGPADDTLAIITFSAMHYVGTVADEPLLVRALVDGTEAGPGPIVFTAGFGSTRFAAQSFSFVARVNAGMHIVQMQWSSASTTRVSYLRNASLLVSVDTQDPAAKRTFGGSVRLDTPKQKSDAEWSAIPQTSLSFTVPEKGTAALTFSGVVKMNQGDFILLRAVVDDGAVTAVPVQTTLAARSYHLGARSLTFTTPELKSGTHKVHFEWKSSLTDVIASATLEACTITALTGPTKTSDSIFTVATQVGFSTTTSSQFAPLPLETEVQVGEVSDVAVTLSAAFGGPAVMIATPTIDGVADEGQETIVFGPSIHYDEKGNQLVMDAGGQSYTFAIKDLPKRESPYRIGLAYRVVQAGVLTEASGTVYDATMTIMSKRRAGPDLAVGANMGAGSRSHEALIEPVHGTRKVLAIIFDPGRKDAPQPDRAFKAGIDRTLFGEVPSAVDYYNVVSGGRLTVEKVDILGPYKGDKAGGETSENHYWDRAAHDPNADGSCDDSTDEYCSPWSEQLAEALTKADKEFDFSAYDVDRDGAISPSELGIIIITPQTSSTGSETKHNFKPYVDQDQRLIADEVIIRSLIHWYTPGIGDGTDAAVEMKSAMVIAHEMAHLFLYLDDAYGKISGFYEDGGFVPCPDGGDPGCQTRAINTAPHPTSMMTYYTVESTPHLDAFHKLQLGWVTPRIVREAREFILPDVKQSKEIWILPRYGTDSREYILLETRFESAVIADAIYDYGILDSGLAVYHMIEPGPSCKSQDGATSQNCTPLILPRCITSDALWDNTYASNFLRPGFRLIQPDITHKYDNGSISFADTLFGNFTPTGQNLLDAAEGAVCPTNIGDVQPVGGQPLLVWSDGTASGYRIKMIKLDSVNKAVMFTLEIDGQ